MTAQNVLESLNLSSNMRVSFSPSGVYELSIEGGAHSSTMCVAVLAPTLYAGVVDFFVEACPNLMSGGGFGQAPGRWFTVNRCIEGRCEVAVPGGGYVVVEPGNVCASFSAEMPHEFRYPLGRYRGIELFVNTLATDEPDLAILREAGVDLDGWVDRIGAATIFCGDAQLEGLMDRIGASIDPLDAPHAKLAFMEFVLAATSRDLEAARPKSFLTKGQMNIAIAVHDQLERDLALPLDAPGLADRAGVGLTTLNGYFSRVYGLSVSAYLRKRRMERAADLLVQTNDKVSDIALCVGYTNPSKFGAAFAREHGCTPTEYRRLARSGSQECPNGS